MFISAGLDTTEIHNHSLRATAISHMYSKGVPKKQIMERSGHHSVGGVRSYEQTSDVEKKLVSQLMSSSGNNQLSVQVNTSVNSPPVTVGNSRNAEGSDQKKIVIKDVTNCTFNFHLN